MKVLSIYWRYIQLAEYYRWCALRGHLLPGNDPITGESRDNQTWRYSHRITESAHRKAHIAMARRYLHAARCTRQNIQD